MAKAQSVAQFMAALVHTRRDEVAALRALILSAAPGLTEQIKWNAPSFGPAGQDRITMRLQPGDRLELIFHRGAKPKDASGFVFEDLSGQIVWAAPDRGVVVISDLAAQEPGLRALVPAWLAATAEGD